MYVRRLTAVLAATALVTGSAVVAAAPAAATGRHGVSRLAELLARQPLAANDGWGSAGAGTTGGSAATAENVFVVSSRAELIDALGGDNDTNDQNDTPKIIFIKGTIDGFEGPDGASLGCAGFADPEYDLDAYLATYDPAVWGRDTEPEGPLEEARVRSLRNQEDQSVIEVGSNTTLFGLRGATLRHMTLMFNEVSNIIVRNLTITDAFDCFPGWDPTDGDTGNWNSNWDYVSVRRGTNFWFDHNTFLTPDDDLPFYFGRKFEIYDGQLDITHTADLVTLSYNVFRDHDKGVLIGSTNNPGGGDPGRLNVTLRHNLFDGIGQRAPRVRFGKVDVYNNYYKLPTSGPFEYQYSWGVGVESATYVENNYLDLRGSGVDPATVVADWGGTALTELGTWVRTGGGIGGPTSLLAAYNAANDPDIGGDVGWVPELRHGPVLPAVVVPAVVGLLAGAGRLPV
jgi:pectate lyase